MILASDRPLIVMGLGVGLGLLVCVAVGCLVSVGVGLASGMVKDWSSVVATAET